MTWRPQCYVCGRFVIEEAYDVIYDYYSGAWEEGYTACPAHGGPRRRADTPEPVTPQAGIGGTHTDRLDLDAMGHCESMRA